jgi:hypothetical protein
MTIPKPRSYEMFPPQGMDIREVELDRNNAIIWAADGGIWSVTFGYDGQPEIRLLDRYRPEQS